MTDRFCPECGQDDVAEILWGLPAFSEKLSRDIDQGKIVLGGCCVSEDSPRWKCNSCSHEWGNRKQ